VHDAESSARARLGNGAFFRVDVYIAGIASAQSACMRLMQAASSAQLNPNPEPPISMSANAIAGARKSTSLCKCVVIMFAVSPDIATLPVV
jgi:hypothetical protein